MKKNIKIIALLSVIVILAGVITAFILSKKPGKKKPVDNIIDKTDDSKQNEEEEVHGSNISYIKDNEIYFINIDTMKSERV